MFDGQSLGLAPFIPAQAYPAKFMALEAANSQYVVANIGSTTYADRTPSIPGRVDTLVSTAGSTVLVDDGGTYDLDATFGNLSAAQLLSAKAVYTAARRAAGFDFIVGLTVAPSGLLTAGEETNRQSVNAALRGNPGLYGYDKIIDLDAIPELANAGDVAYYFDGTHWSDAATTLVAQALAAALV